MVINYKKWVSLNLIPRAFPFSSGLPDPPLTLTRREKPWERDWGSGLCVSKMAQQEGALEDYIEASVMIRYNNNQRKF